MEMTRENIDEFICFVDNKNWQKLSLGEKMELVILSKMSGEVIAQQMSAEEEELYYKTILGE